MNPPSAPPVSSVAVQPAATALLSTRPPFIVSLLRVMMAIGGAITVILGVAAYTDFLPQQWAVIVGAATAFLLALQQGIIAAGDILDDGIRNNSFELGRKVPLALCLLLPLGLMACTTAGKSEAQLTLAEIGYTAAQGALVVAEAELNDRFSNPDTPAWQKWAAQLAVSQAKKTVSREQAKIDAAFAKLIAGEVPPELAMPAHQSPSGKTALYVIP